MEDKHTEEQCETLLEMKETPKTVEEDKLIVEIKEPSAHLDDFRGLTKKELEKYENDPFWKRLRLTLFILFWLIWGGILIAAIVIIVVSPKCPYQPQLSFWQKKSMYWLDVFAFKDTNADGVGDLKGVTKSLSYIKNQVGCDVIIMEPIFEGLFANISSAATRPGRITNFMGVDAKLGALHDLKELSKESRKIGIELIMAINFKDLLSTKDSPDEAFIKRVQKIIRFWMGDYNIQGILLTEMNGRNITTLGPTLDKFRETIDDIEKKTDKPRLLALDSGNEWGDIDDSVDDLVDLLEEPNNGPVQMIVSRLLLKKYEDNKIMPLKSIKMYYDTHNTMMNVAWTIGSSAVSRYNKINNLILSYVLPGPTIVYFGTEIGLSRQTMAHQIYPRNRKIVRGALQNHLPMAWDRDGRDFTEAEVEEETKNALWSKETVKAALAVASTNQFMSLTKKLKTIRLIPSVLFGKMKIIDDSDDNKIIERNSKGFPSVFVAFIRRAQAYTLSNSDSCKKAKVLLVANLGGNSKLTAGTEICMENVYLSKGASYIFECVPNAKCTKK